jgi:uncharacterized protein (TIGR02145 family)
MKHSFRSPFFIFFLFVFLTGACENEGDDGAPVVVTNELGPVRRTSVECSGSIDTAKYKPLMAAGFCWNTSGSPSLEDNFVLADAWRPEFTYVIQGLLPATTYYIRAYASSLEGVGYGEVRSFTTLPAGFTVVYNPASVYGSVSDVEGNVYKTVELGSQTWMAENLKTTRFNDNTEIPLVTGGTEWENMTSPAYCWYENNEAIYKDFYGAYYNWYTVNTGKLCPSGWHVPSDEEWKTLEMQLGMSQEDADFWELRGTTEGLEIKETGTHNWFPDENIAGTNESGFTALPGGLRMGYDGGNIEGEGYVSFWWTSTRYLDYDIAVCRWVLDLQPKIIRVTRDCESGFNVRCIKD